MTRIIYSDPRNNAASLTGGGVFISPAAFQLCVPMATRTLRSKSFDKGENNA
ncbi:hypothetical protein ACVIWV_006206 [Bradyrhizobium diazoefficiens]